MRSTTTIHIQVKNSAILVKQWIHASIQIIIGLLMLIALATSLTNRILVFPIILLLGVSFLAIAVVISTKKLTIPKLWLSLVILSLYFIFSALASQLPIKDILTFNFFRRDGNFFVSFFPLLLVPLILKAQVKSIKWWNMLIEAIIWVIALITDLLSLSFLLHHPIGHVDMYGIYFYLFESHNGAGTFYLVMFFISLLMTLNPSIKRSRIGNLFATISFSLALWLTRSRGSIVGLIFSLAILMIQHIRPINKYKQLLIGLLLSIIIGASIILVGIGYQGWKDIGKPTQGYDELRLLPTFLNMASTEQYERFGNIADRLFYLWPRAFDDFLKSPILGIGFTRFNDVPMYLEGIPHYVMLNTTHINIIFSSAHAHHTFLHVLAETGLVGLILLVIFIKDLLEFVKNIHHFLAPGIYYAIWGTIGASFTEHRFFTPSGMLVVSLLIIIALLGAKPQRLQNNTLTHKVKTTAK